MKTSLLRRRRQQQSDSGSASMASSAWATKEKPPPLPLESMSGKATTRMRTWSQKPTRGPHGKAAIVEDKIATASGTWTQTKSERTSSGDVRSECKTKNQVSSVMCVLFIRCMLPTSSQEYSLKTIKSVKTK